MVKSRIIFIFRERALQKCISKVDNNSNINYSAKAQIIKSKYLLNVQEIVTPIKFIVLNA